MTQRGDETRARHEAAAHGQHVLRVVDLLLDFESHAGAGAWRRRKCAFGAKLAFSAAVRTPDARADVMPIYCSVVLFRVKYRWGGRRLRNRAPHFVQDLVPRKLLGLLKCSQPFSSVRRTHAHQSSLRHHLTWTRAHVFAQKPAASKNGVHRGPRLIWQHWQRRREGLLSTCHHTPPTPHRRCVRNTRA